jgi:2-polyprenyl-3-methyl-5-hydroxy-6-metoxy-1,4-benzoquinol methylase
MDDNQALKAWNLVKDTDSPLKERVWLRVKHAFNPDDYKKYYSEQLVENAVSDDLALDCTELYPRFKWLVNNILSKGYKTCVDLGCADGYLPLTLANKGLKTYGVNLYAPSIKIARERASKFNLDASFDVKDIFDAEGKYDAVVLFEILEHLQDPEYAIKKCFELLNDGGSVYISTPSTEHIGITLHKENPHEGWDDSLPAGHLRIFSREELTKLLKDYKVEEWITDDQGCYLLEVKKG